jgi:tetratricopeptide (TPR) repeat protein
MRRKRAKTKHAPLPTPVSAHPWPWFPAWLAALLLGVVTLAVYAPVRHYPFVMYDDWDYVSKNLHVLSGLTVENITWAFTRFYAANWHPLTWISHMLDCQLWGTNAGTHHVVNIIFHAGNTVLLFFLLREMTGALWRSALVAAFFAWHPLHVESVTWIAERKDVLSAFFWMLTLLAYTRYARNPNRWRYLLVLFLFILGLMSKPMVVTLPFVLLLLDFWPLKRLQSPPGNLRRLIYEKVPLLVIAGASCVVTYLAQQRGGAVQTLENLPLTLRVANALTSYVIYLKKIVWPTDLAVFYPLPTTVSSWALTVAILLLLGITALAIAMRGRCPYLLVGWFWYLGTLIPVIGFVQLGAQALADRYTYIPSVGVLISIIWGVEELTRHWRHRRFILSFIGLSLLFLCLLLTRQQLGYWRNSETLLRHALEVSPNNYLTHYNLGYALREKGDHSEAARHFEEAIRLCPNYVDAYRNLAVELNQEGRSDEAIRQLLEATRIDPDSWNARNDLGTALARQGRTEEAISQLQEAIRLKPDFAEARNDLGAAFLQIGRFDDAISQLQEAVQLKPDFAEARNDLGAAFLQIGRLDEAVSQLQEATRLKPDFAEARDHLGVALAQQGRTGEAISQFQEAIRFKPDFVAAQNDLGATLLQNGRIDEAISQLQKALQIEPTYAPAQRNLEIALGMKKKSN